MLINDYKYYLETNSLFQINKFNKDVLKQSFTSAFALTELISGVSERNFGKRKAIVKSIESSEITVDWRFPEELFFDAFDCTMELDFQERRTAPLRELLMTLRRSEDFGEFVNNKVNAKYGLEFFQDYDNHWNQSFTQSLESGNKEIKQILNSGNKEKLKFDGREYFISNRIELQNFLIENPRFNISTTVLALSNILMEMCEFEELTVEDVYESYNDFIRHFVWAHSLYNALKILNSETAKRNDILDLLHLVYLRNSSSTLIVSDDKIYERLSFKLKIRSNELYT